MARMTEKEKKLGQLYKRLKIVQKAYDEGKTHKDYLAIIYDLKMQIQTFNTKLADDKITLRINNVEDTIVSFIVDENENNEEIGSAKVKMMDKVGILEYSLSQNATRKNYDLRMIKLLCEFMKSHGLSEVKTITYKEDIEKNNNLSTMGAKRDLTKVRPYNVYSLKIK